MLRRGNGKIQVEKICDYETWNGCVNLVWTLFSVYNLVLLYLSDSEYCIW